MDDEKYIKELELLLNKWKGEKKELDRYLSSIETEEQKAERKKAWNDDLHEDDNGYDQIAQEK